MTGRAEPAPLRRTGNASPSDHIELRDRIDRVQAIFFDKGTERAYRAHLQTDGFERERTLQVIGAIVFIAFGFLDVVVAGPLGNEFAILRLVIAAPLIFLVLSCSWIPSQRRHVGLATVLASSICAAVVLYMTWRLPAVGGPPYIIGFLVTMIYASCLMRIEFVLAAPAFTIISVAYCILLTLRSDLPRNEAMAGYFFMVSIAGVAIVTVHFQEVQARLNWLRGVVRQRDAARIERLLVDATAADRSKLNFLSVLSHELRTPLHQIIGYSELARDQQTPSANDIREHIEQVIGSARDLLGKLSKMLRYADATAGRLEFRLDSVSISELVEQTRDQFMGLASSRSVAVDISGVAPCTLNLDQHHTLFALGAILDNAIKASGPGTTIKIEGERLPAGGYELTIIDQGCGMTAAQLTAALSPFEQTEAVRSRSREGLGLGLTIARRLLQDQHASLAIDSVAGQGTEVSIEFEPHAAAAPHVSAA